MKPSARLQMTSLGDESPLIKISNNTSTSTSNTRDNQPTSTSKATEVSGNHKGGSSRTNPIIDASALINGRIFETNWHELTGSELIFDDYGELIGQVKEHLTCNDKVKFIAKKLQNNDLNATLAEYVDFDEGPAGEESVKSEGNTKLKPSPFLRNAIKAAKRKEYS